MNRTHLIYLLIFSLALNGAAAATIAFHQLTGHVQAEGASFAQKPVADFLRENLGLTNEQTSRVLERIDRTKAQSIRLRDLMSLRRTEMVSLISTVPVDRTAVEAKISEINHIQGQLRVMAAGTIIGVTESLPPDARQKFGAYLRERGRLCDGCVPGPGKGLFQDPKPET
ncbi:MAG: periplasmic heavy metal sensor [Desulfomonile tiedjei]|nr:periplasmic heavy metal sensor [Desulfomonile tiedjei]